MLFKKLMIFIQLKNFLVHGGFSEWSEWTLCSLSCNGGERIRTRACNNPTPQFNGLLCFGNMVESQSCNPQFCPSKFDVPLKLYK